VKINPTARNVVIIALIAAAVVIIPGGGKAANTVGQAVQIAFLGSLVWFASLMYRQHRADIYSLGERNRAIVYASIGVLTLTITATSRMWATGIGLIAWFALVGAAAYSIFAVIWAARQY
jgi:hypothetical protein